MQQKKRKSKRPFPLHLTPFEHYMFVDDVPNYPMTFIVQFEFRGSIDKSAFMAAVGESMERHPLLAALIGPAKRNQDCFLYNEGYPLVNWGELGDPIEFPDGEFIDLRTEIGLRIWVRHDDEKAIVTSQFHHSVCDGIGSYQFLGDVLYFYAIRTADDPPPAPMELDRKRLRDRGKVAYNLNNFRLPNGKYQRTWGEALKLMLRRNYVLKPPTSKPSHFERPFPGILSHTFDKKEYRALRLAAQDRGQIINDMLLEKLFESLHQWRDEHRGLLPAKNVCVMMPMNLRETSDHDISACNLVAHAFFRATKNQLNDTQAFRSELGNQVLHFKHHRHKIPFMHMLAGAQHFYPRILKASLFWNRSMATAILSNTGDPTRQFLADFPREQGLLKCGNLMLEDLSGVPPMRPGTRATISIFTYRRVLKICLRCDPNLFSPADTQQLLDRYVQNMSDTIA